MGSNPIMRTAFICTNCRQKLAASLLPQRQAFNRSSHLSISTDSKRLFSVSSGVSARVRPSARKIDQSSNVEPQTDLDKLEASFANTRKSKKPPPPSVLSSETPTNLDEATTWETPVPWYLQEQQSQQVHEPPEKNPFLERQRLPDMPSDPPPIVQPLLNHLSVDLGLDYLTLIDLRVMDPPPALGANLLMLFGSARSEKHLNVSADRLCRWLRTNYQLKPDADGLLGRNELKLKMKRKNRRAKMMTAAGAAYTPDADDGITTGWICVNVGSIENGPEANRQYQNAIQAANFTGFGPSHDPAKLVIQILTQEKRNELDLEGLWNEALDTSLRRKAGAQRAREKEIALQEAKAGQANETPLEDISTSSPTASTGSQPVKPSRSRYPSQQVRSFHSSRSTALEAETVTSQQAQSVLSDQPSVTYQADIKPSKPTDQGASVEEALNRQLDLLYNSNPKEAASLLGQGEDDMSSTSFLRSFYAVFPPIPEPVHLLAQFQLQCHAVKFGANGYSPARILEQLHQLQACAVSIPEHIFLLALEAVLLPYHNFRKPEFRKLVKLTKQESSSPDFLPNRVAHSMTQTLKNTFDVLTFMEFNGHEIRTPHILTLIAATIEAPNFEGPNFDPRNPKTIMLPRRHKLYRFLFLRAIEELTMPLHSTEAKNTLFISLMKSYLHGHTRDLSTFWTLWHQLPRMMHRRPPEMYALMFDTAARVGPASECQTVLMQQFPEMQREEPPVECEEPVASALKRCLEAAEVHKADYPWRTMWNAVEEGLIRNR